ncbi:MAG: bifunctional folylpolyglutamate synthase/dihydrofolate synthase [Myxococcales bacterium]|nr:bifunctional folylpolyglutamate synthase/dihydrofolate synthase [Myxococcales bacterium]
MAIPEWQRALFDRRTLGIHLGLDVIRAAYERLGRPGRAIPAVHVVGTNGKGSTSAMVAHGLRAAGRRVGLFTSPHLHRIGERVQVEGAPLDDDVLKGYVDRVLEVDATGDLPGPISFFEILTLAALMAFEDAGVDNAVFECGLGGRLDATRVANIELTLFTPIALDHLRLLGPDLATIAGEKAAVLENRAPAISAQQLPTPRAVLNTAAARWGTALRFVGEAARAPKGLPGAHQRQNAGLALAGLAALLGPEKATLELLDGVRWPGRLETIRRGAGTMTFDVAHNPHGVAALARHLAATPPPAAGRLIVFGCMLGKDGPEMIRSLAALGAPMLVVPPGAREGWDAAQLEEAVGEGADIAAAPSFDAPEAQAAIAERLAVGGEVVVCGSCYLVGAVRGRILEEREDAVLLSDPPAN